MSYGPMSGGRTEDYLKLNVFLLRLTRDQIKRRGQRRLQVVDQAQVSQWIMGNREVLVSAYRRGDQPALERFVINQGKRLPSITSQKRRGKRA